MESFNPILETHDQLVKNLEHYIHSLNDFKMHIHDDNYSEYIDIVTRLFGLFVSQKFVL